MLKEEYKREPMPQEDLRRLQMILLEIMIEVDRICRKRNVRYHIYAGTLLGAVRHGGFIPWDDDADIGMLREDYEQFLDIVDEELDTSRFYLQHHRNTPGYRWGYAKMRRKGTLYLRAGQDHLPYPSGASIDIFPFDSVPDSFLLHKIHTFACFLVRKMQWSEVGRVTVKNPVMRRFLWLVSRIPTGFIWKCYDLLVKLGRKPRKRVRLLTFKEPGGYTANREWTEHTVDMLFEGHVFRGLRDYDPALHHKYGDYMKYPPKEEQEGHHYPLEYNFTIEETDE